MHVASSGGSPLIDSHPTIEWFSVRSVIASYCFLKFLAVGDPVILHPTQT
jgi:hypothetical protein